MALAKLDLLSLSFDERLDLAEALWDSLAEGRDSMPLTPAQAEELDRRVEAFDKDGDFGQPWSVVVAELRAQRR
jgi:putative addiction module component (TIGR02574 family)